MRLLCLFLGIMAMLSKPFILARAISEHSNGNIPVANVLKGINRVSNYQAKKDGHPLSAEELGFHQVRTLPKEKVPYLLDNVVDTGTTAKAAVKALGGGIVLSYAMSDTLLEHRERSGLHR